MGAGFIALVLAGPAWAASPLEAGASGVGSRYVGADASVSLGVDRWTGGGGPAVVGQLALGGAWGGGRTWSRAAWAGSWVEAVPGGVFDGHVGVLQLRHRSGVSVLAAATGSGSVGWGQGAVLGGVETRLGPAIVSGSAGPAARGGGGGEGAGLTATAGLAASRGRVRPAAEVRGTVWGPGALPDVGQAVVSARIEPALPIALTPSVSLLATGAGPDAPAAGLPAGRSRVGRVGLAAEIAPGRTLRLQADAAYEAGPGYRRAVAFGGVAVQLGRVRAAGCDDVAAGTVTFRLAAPGAAQVAVAGSFTGWEPQAMARDGDAWIVGLPLQPGTYEYVYLVDGAAVVPPEAALTRPDGWGGANGVLRVEVDPCG